jgi:hypothetical protein
VDANAIIRLVSGVTREWCKTRKAEERESARALRRLEALTRQDSEKDKIKCAAFEVMEAAYLHASTDNTLPAKARQIMYAARPLVMALTGNKCRRGRPLHLSNRARQSASRKVSARNAHHPAAAHSMPHARAPRRDYGPSSGTQTTSSSLRAKRQRPA